MISSPARAISTVERHSREFKSCLSFRSCPREPREFWAANRTFQGVLKSPRWCHEPALDGQCPLDAWHKECKKDQWEESQDKKVKTNWGSWTLNTTGNSPWCLATENTSRSSPLLETWKDLPKKWITEAAGSSAPIHDIVRHRPWGPALLFLSCLLQINFLSHCNLSQCLFHVFSGKPNPGKLCSCREATDQGWSWLLFGPDGTLGVGLLLKKIMQRQTQLWKNGLWGQQ